MLSTSLPSLLPTQKLALVDGSNIGYIEKKGGKAVVQNILAVMDAARRNRYDSICIVKSNLKYGIDDCAYLKDLISSGVIYEAPAGSDDDKYVLEYGKLFNADIIISNDRFLKYQKIYHDQIAKRTTVMIIRGIASIQFKVQK